MPSGDDLPTYKISINDISLSQGFLKKSKDAAKHLGRIARDLAETPAPHPKRLFRIGDETWPAASPQAAARIWAALYAPDLIGSPNGHVRLPQILEVIPAQTLASALDATIERTA